MSDDTSDVQILSAGEDWLVGPITLDFGSKQQHQGSIKSESRDEAAAVKDLPPGVLGQVGVVPQHWARLVTNISESASRLQLRLLPVHRWQPLRPEW
eukprot:scaffold178519_cov16-Prasinocladus_malaysianus.AAC.1